MAAVLDVADVTKRFGAAGPQQVTALAGLTLSVAQGEFVSVVGPSGCGKSTILNLASGLDLPDEGTVQVHGVDVAGPNERVGFMLQKDLLLPWRSIRRNVEFGLEARGMSAAERRARAAAEIERCRLGDVADRYPYQLSGGMRQRAALARTLVARPDLLLLDEPFSALDAQTKLILQRSFSETIATEGVTALLITHDLQEAVLMSDRILVMSARPGTVLDEIELDLPDKRDLLARRVHRRVHDYVDYLFDALHLSERAV